MDLSNLPDLRFKHFVFKEELDIRNLGERGQGAEAGKIVIFI